MTAKKDDLFMSASALQSTCVQDLKGRACGGCNTIQRAFSVYCCYMSPSIDRGIKKLEFTSMILTGDLHAQMLQVPTHHITSLLFEVIGPSSVWFCDWTLKAIS